MVSVLFLGMQHQMAENYWLFSLSKKVSNLYVQFVPGRMLQNSRPPTGFFPC